MVDDQDDSFPEASTIQVDHFYVDPFTIPKWCDQGNYAFAWVDIRDDIQRHNAMEVGFYKIVTRMSSCIKGKPSDRDFRNHGAVERQAMILMYRPKDINERFLSRPVLAHKEMVETLESGKAGR